MIGKLSPEVLEALLETLPIEFSIVDANDEVLAWNRHETRLFKRPVGVVGRNVRNCHPEKGLAKVEKIIAEMKAGTREKARFWIDMTLDAGKPPQKILIEYYALRDKTGKYLGCLESGQNITELQSLKGQQRLLD
jgi:uncharacterized protein